MVSDGRRVCIAYLNAPHSLASQIHPDVETIFLRRNGIYSLKSLRVLIRKVKTANVRTLVAVDLYPLLYIIPWAFTLRTQVKTLALVNTSEFLGSQKFKMSVYRVILRRVSEIIFGSQSQMELWTEKYSLPKDKCSVIHNGVDETRFSPQQLSEFRARARSMWPLPDDSFVIGAVGRLAPEKNFEILIGALAWLVSEGTDAYLLLAGDGNCRVELLCEAERLSVKDRLILTGNLKDVRLALALMDVFVLPSRAVETFSNAALEAMASGVPVILSDIGGASEMIENGRSGLLFTVGDSKGLTSCLYRLVGDAQIRKILGNEARKRIEEHFRFSRMLADYQKRLRP
jgi:glycosyltransferase involved in cell wall biosynthesis